MKTILDELFFGNIEPNVEYFEKDSEHAQIMKIISDNEEKLFSILEGEEKAMLQAFSNAQISLNTITSRENFVSGFKLGALIMLEVLSGKDEFIFESETEHKREGKPC